jgi:hypothetical protein
MWFLVCCLGAREAGNAGWEMEVVWVGLCIMGMKNGEWINRDL